MSTDQETIIIITKKKKQKLEHKFLIELQLLCVQDKGSGPQLESQMSERKWPVGTAEGTLLNVVQTQRRVKASHIGRNLNIYTGFFILKNSRVAMLTKRLDSE